MTALSPWRYGVVLAATIAILYAACAVATLVAPGVVARVLDVVVHGLDIGVLTARIPPPSGATIGAGLLCVTGYAFIAGSLYGAIRNRLARGIG